MEYIGVILYMKKYKKLWKCIKKDMFFILPVLPVEVHEESFLLESFVYEEMEDRER